jgi:hypothetical protein
LQRAILLIALAETSEGDDEMATNDGEGEVATKQIRVRLRARGVKATDDGFSRALARLESRGLIKRLVKADGDSNKTFRIRLTPAGIASARALANAG